MRPADTTAEVPKRDRSGPKQLARGKTVFRAKAGVEATEALAEPLPLTKRGRTMFAPNTGAMRAANSRSLTEYHRLQASKKLAEQIGGRDTSAERVEHVPAEPVYVSPQRAAELQNRPSVSGRIVRRDPETGAIVAIGRFVRELVNGRYVTRWEDEVRA